MKFEEYSKDGQDELLRAALLTRDQYMKLRLRGRPFESDRVMGISHAHEVTMKQAKKAGIVPPEHIQKAFPKIWKIKKKK